MSHPQTADSIFVYNCALWPALRMDRLAIVIRAVAKSARKAFLSETNIFNFYIHFHHNYHLTHTYNGTSKRRKRQRERYALVQLLSTR